MAVKPLVPDLDWRRLSRWCLLGTIVMLLWLLYPVARCSFSSFEETPINDVEEAGGPGHSDQSRVDEGRGFFRTWLSATAVCYERTPLTGQEEWKTYLLYGLVGATVATKIVARFANKRHGL